MKTICRRYEDLIEIRDFVEHENEKTITDVLQDIEENNDIDEDYMFSRFVIMTMKLRNDYKTIKEVVQKCYKRILIDEQTTEKELQDYEERLNKNER